MSDPHPFSSEPIPHRKSPSTHISQYRFGLILTLTGILLVIVAFFTPWLEVFKLNDPSFPFPERGYSPWMVLESGQLGVLGVVTWVYLLLILGMALSSLTVLLTHTSRRRSQAISIARALAMMSLVMIVITVPAVIVDLTFVWPYLNSNLVYGAYLAGAGFVSVLIGLAMLTGGSTRQ